MNKNIYKSGSAADRVMAEASGLFDEYSVSVHDKAPTSAETNEQKKVKPEQAEAFVGLNASPVNLHNAAGPNLQITHEKPEHRIMIYLKAQGHTNKEIAKIVGYSEAWISQITRQPWFRKRLVEELREAGLDPIKSFLNGEALNSLDTLVKIRDDKNIPASARVAAVNSLLDRTFGKPTQHIETTAIPAKSVPQEKERIEQELKEIDEQLRSRGQPTSSQLS